MTGPGRRAFADVITYSFAGVVIPAVAYVAARTTVEGASLGTSLAAFARDLFGFEGLTSAVFSALPFVVLGSLQAMTTLTMAPGVHGHRPLRGLSFALVLLLAFATAATHWAFWSDVFGPGRPKSTGGVALLLVSLGGTAAVVCIFGVAVIHLGLTATSEKPAVQQ